MNKRILFCIQIVLFVPTGQEVASHWYSAVRQYNYAKEPDVLHANVNAGKRHTQHSNLEFAKCGTEQGVLTTDTASVNVRSEGVARLAQ